MTKNRDNNSLRGSTGPSNLLAPIAMTLLLAGCQTVSNAPEQVNADQDSLGKAEKNFEDAKKSSLKVAKKDIVVPKRPDDLWIRMRHGLGMNLDREHPRIQAELNWYIRNKSYFSRMSSRAEPYLYFIIKEAETRQVPLELALMPVVESSFDPFAYSPAGASGLWQFMPATGRHFNLEQNWWYDGRRDVVAATRAALDYMASLHRTFGDWELALAAYNSGQGRVQNAINRNRKAGKPTSFWDLGLPAETTAYVPKLIALGKIIRNPDKYGINLPAIPNKPYFAKVQIGAQLDLAKAAKISKVPLDTLYRLNPALNRWATPPEGPHHLVVPVNKAEKFRTALAALPLEDRLQWQRYTVKSGDTLGEIAQTFRTRPAFIAETNKLDGTMIRVGQTLLIPVAAREEETYNLSADQRLATRQNRAVSNSHKVDYTVKSGDSFWSISRNFNVGVNELARWNNMSPRDTLRAEQNLVVWMKVDNGNKDAVIRKVTYRIRSGDSLSGIANRFKVRVSDIRDWNTDMNERYIHPGQMVTLYVDVTKTQIN